jgi:hypothetical protein
VISIHHLAFDGFGKRLAADRQRAAEDEDAGVAAFL